MDTRETAQDAPVTTADLRKGTEVKLANGWKARIEDNMKHGKTRMCTVFGYFTEMGSVYATDIVMANVNGRWTQVQLTPAQVKDMKSRRALGF